MTNMRPGGICRPAIFSMPVSGRPSKHDTDMSRATQIDLFEHIVASTPSITTGEVRRVSIASAATATTMTDAAVMRIERRILWALSCIA